MIVDAASRMQPLEGLQDGPQSFERRTVSLRGLPSCSNDLVKQYASDRRLDRAPRWKEPIHVRRRHRHVPGNISDRRLPVTDPPIQLRRHLQPRLRKR